MPEFATHGLFGLAAFLSALALLVSSAAKLVKSCGSLRSKKITRPSVSADSLLKNGLS
jgi:hypothetical protein